MSKQRADQKKRVFLSSRSSAACISSCIANSSGTAGACFCGLVRTARCATLTAGCFNGMGTPSASEKTVNACLPSCGTFAPLSSNLSSHSAMTGVAPSPLMGAGGCRDRAYSKNSHMNLVYFNSVWCFEHLLEKALNAKSRNFSLEYPAVMQACRVSE